MKNPQLTRYSIVKNWVSPLSQEKYKDLYMYMYVYVYISHTHIYIYISHIYVYMWVMVSRGVRLGEWQNGWKEVGDTGF